MKLDTRRMIFIAIGADVALVVVATAVWAVTTLTDPDGRNWDIDDQGTSTPPSDCGSGHIGSGSSGSYNTFDIMCVATPGSSFTSECSSSDVYCGNVAPSTEMSGRQLVLGEDTLHGLTIQRRVYVPSSGPADADSFARYFDTFHNPTASPITVQVRFGSVVGPGTNDLGSDSSTTTHASASGDTVIDETDEWFTTDDSSTTSGDPSLGYVVQGIGAAERLDFARQNPYAVSAEQDELMWGFEDVTIAAGETIALLHFLIQEGNQTEAQSEAANLSLAQTDAVAGLTGAQLTMIRNFAFCHDCDGDGYAIDDGDCNDWNDLVNPGVTTDPCDGEDNDCDASTPDGAVEVWFGDPCDGDDDDLCEDDSYACIGAVQGCLDSPTDLSDVCDGVDNDCDAASNDGDEDLRVGAPCDGDDPDLCEEGTGTCVAGVFVCTDSDLSAPDACDGIDNDCNPLTVDGEGETWWNTPCDSDDEDLCEDDRYICNTSAAQECEDASEDLSDVCDGDDNDCNPATPDGYGDERVDAPCDGDDPDTCAEGIGECVSGAFHCTDTMEDTPELCDNIDNDCDVMTPDGADADWYATPCDGLDTDLCEEGIWDCIAGVKVCNDSTGNLEDICNGLDDDCDPETIDGSDESWSGQPCDGPDADFCSEGNYDCISGVQSCNDFTDDLSEQCNGVDDDCDPSTLEMVDNDGDGFSACDGDCNDADSAIYPGADEICDGVDHDCDIMTDHDGDGDGFLDCDGDCAPMNSAIYPDAPQDCTNGLDNDCDGVIDMNDVFCTMNDEPAGGCACASVRSADAGTLPVAILALVLTAMAVLVRRRG